MCANETGLTPMFEQYHRLKGEHPDAILLFRMGDFYEMFYEDAKLAARVLGLALTSRSKGPDAPPMAGIPYHALDRYLGTLVQSGLRVAICEQMGDPKATRGLMDRDVIRIVTAGTLTEDALLPGSDDNFLASLVVSEGQYGLSWVELSTGAFFADEEPLGALAAALARIRPSEILIPEEDAETRRAIQGLSTAAVAERPRWQFDRHTARQALLAQFQTESLRGFGCEELDSGVRAAGAVMQYLQETQKTTLAHIRKIERIRRGSFLEMNANTIRALELVEGMTDRTRAGSLFALMDRTVTAMGARMLKSWLLAPLVEAEAIRSRQEAVAELAENRDLRRKLRELLEGVHDVERLSTRASCGRANPRDLASLARSLTKLPLIRSLLEAAQCALLTELCQGIDPLEDLSQLLQSAIEPSPPLVVSDGGIIRVGYNARLDEFRSIGADAKSWISRYQAGETERTRIPSLKVGFNSVFGYYIEVTNTHRGLVPPEYVRKQTVKNAERYITPELKEYETKVLNAGEEAKKLEAEIFAAVRLEIGRRVDRLFRTAASLAALDTLAALAELAIERRYVRPEVDDSTVLDIRDGRHPVVEAALAGERFVPNDTALGTENLHVMILTGPNMAGKSTYIRQVALIVIMAQMGSFVPAGSARIGAADKLFTRVGASDELTSGQSTFMVEMTETAYILNNATARSLIVLDEVGRGTSTFDGLSLAWAITEYIHSRIGARTLFATHYHQLTELAELLPGIANYNVAVKEYRDRVVFLHRIMPGGTDKSYGVHVARLAGVPDEVIERSKRILGDLERVSLGLAESAAREGHPAPLQLALFAPRSARSPVIEELKRVEPQKLTPLEALAKLDALKKMAEER